MRFMKLFLRGRYDLIGLDLVMGCESKTVGSLCITSFFYITTAAFQIGY